MAFLKVVLIIIISLWVLKILARLFLPLFLTWFVKKTFSKMQNKFDFEGNPTFYTKNDANVKPPKETKKKFTRKNDDYIDFEEVK